MRDDGKRGWIGVAMDLGGSRVGERGTVKKRRWVGGGGGVGESVRRGRHGRD